MKVNKFVETEIEVAGIGLLNVEEAEMLPEKIRAIKKFWWLKTVGKTGEHEINYRAMFVCKNGDICYNGQSIKSYSAGVRPVLFLNPALPNFKKGDKFEWNGYDWTLISDSKALCNSIIKNMKYKKDANRYKLLKIKDVYEVSDIKQFLEQWLEDTQKGEQE